MTWSLFIGGGIYAAGIFFRRGAVQAAGASLITIALVLRVVDHLRSGRAYARGKYYSRERDTGAYWRIVMTFITAIGIAIWLIVTLLRGKTLNG